MTIKARLHAVPTGKRSYGSYHASCAVSRPVHCVVGELADHTNTMRSDLLSKRIFFAGCFGLPWLWVVHVLFHVGGSKEEGDEQDIVNSDDRTFRSH